MTEKKFYKNQVTTAERFDGSRAMIRQYDISVGGWLYCGNQKVPIDMSIETLEGDMNIEAGNWIATGVNGEHWAIADDVFKMTYNLLPVVPIYIDKYIRRTQAAKINLVNVMAAAYKADRFVEDPDPELVWINQHPDTFATAWLLKDWDVEEEPR